MSVQQNVQTVDLIINDEWLSRLKLDDFKLCFNMVKKGDYGQVYRIDGNVILTWLNRYEHERYNYYGNKSEQEAQTFKQDNRPLKDYFMKQA